MKSLYTKYRPNNWSEVIGQDSIVKILKQQIETNHIFNCMIFSGTSGTGKTTLARIYANELNHNEGIPIEIDAASNNSVENVRQIVATASERSLNSKYKVYIIDEAHMLSNQAWNAFLKCIEEPPKYTIFIFCTTDPHKIPETIQNRCMRFNFTRVSSTLINQRLNYICENESEPLIYNWEETTDYISKNCDGEVRKAISMLETCIRYDNDMSIEKSLEALGNSSYENFFNLVNAIIDGSDSNIITIVDTMYDSGVDLKRFIDSFTVFCLDIFKYILTNNINTTRIPISYEDQVKFAVGINNVKSYYNYILDKLLELKTILKNDTNEKTTIEICLNKMCRFV